jgi:hypothetical protein
MMGEDVDFERGLRYASCHKGCTAEVGGMYV